MAKDSQGMDLGQVEALVTAAIMIVPYSTENKITPEMIASSKATPELPALQSIDRMHRTRQVRRRQPGFARRRRPARVFAGRV